MNRTKVSLAFVLLVAGMAACDRDTAPPSAQEPTAQPAVDFRDLNGNGTKEPYEDSSSQVDYEEGIYVGYRYYDTFGVQPAYEFGYGLSYTDFRFSDLSLSSDTFADGVIATVSVTNTGGVAGKEVVQLYLRAPQDRVHKPRQELKGFAKTGLLAPGASERLEIALTADDLASYDDERSAWVADAGTYRVHLGASSKDIRATATFELEKEIVVQEVVAELSPWGRHRRNHCLGTG